MALLRCSVMSSIGGSQLAFLTITDGQSTNYAAPPADTRRVCACTFYLVFKEPEVVPPATRTVFRGTLQSYQAFQPLSRGWFFWNRLPPSLLPLGRAPGKGIARRTACMVRRTASNPPNIRSQSLTCQPFAITAGPAGGYGVFTKYRDARNPDQAQRYATPPCLRLATDYGRPMVTRISRLAAEPPSPFARRNTRS